MKHRVYMGIGSIIFICLLLIAIYGLLYAHDYEAIDLLAIEAQPNADYWLGTDELGRDVYTRLLFATGVSMGIGFIATSLQILLGTTLGVISGYYGGRVDFIIQRCVDIVMCFPLFILASAIAAVVGPSIINLVIIISVLSWTGTCKIVRADVIQLKQMDFILASELSGFTFWELVRYHFLPNLQSKLFISATLSMANAIIMEASMSFLGLGVRLPMPSLGNMLSKAMDIRSLQNLWWTWVPAGIYIVLCVFSINLIGEGMRIRSNAKEVVYARDSSVTD